MFLLLRPILHTFLFLLYVLLHYEPLLTWSKKILTFLIHVSSVYIGYSPGVHISFYSLYYLDSENGIVISKIMNAFAFSLVALPNLLVISINSSANDKWKGIDIVTLVFTCCYIIFCGIFYVICNMYELDYEIDNNLSLVW